MEADTDLTRSTRLQGDLSRRADREDPLLLQLWDTGAGHDGGREGHRDGALVDHLHSLGGSLVHPQSSKIDHFLGWAGQFNLEEEEDHITA